MQTNKQHLGRKTPEIERNKIMKSPITTQIKSFLTGGLATTLLITAIVSFSAATAGAGPGNAGNPGVLPPQSHPYGKSYGEWAAKWVQWALSIPADRNPLTDTTGVF